MRSGGLVRDERGETTVSTLLSITLTLVVVLSFVNVFMYLYGQSAVRAALDEGVRAGSRVDAGTVVCQQRAEQVLSDLLGGPYGAAVTVECRPSAVTGELTAIGQGTFTSPLPGVPDWSVFEVAHATQEVAP